jgi:hypothetical protein
MYALGKSTAGCDLVLQMYYRCPHVSACQIGRTTAEQQLQSVSFPLVSAPPNSLHVTWFQRKQLFHWQRRKWPAAAIARAAGISIVSRNKL